MKIKEWFEHKKAGLYAAAAVGTMSLGIVPAFAADSSGDVGITADMLKPVVDGIKANLNVIIPVGIVIFGIMLGIMLVPKIIKKFMG